MHGLQYIIIFSLDGEKIGAMTKWHEMKWVLPRPYARCPEDIKNYVPNIVLIQKFSYTKVYTLCYALSYELSGFLEIEWECGKEKRKEKHNCAFRNKTRNINQKIIWQIIRKGILITKPKVFYVKWWCGKDFWLTTLDMVTYYKRWNYSSTATKLYIYNYQR